MSEHITDNDAPEPDPDAFGFAGYMLGAPATFGCCHWKTVHEDSVPDPEGAVRLADHFSATVELRIAEIQPQYGLVQLNATRQACGCLVSCDVNRDDFLAAVAKILRVTITDGPRVIPPGADRGSA
jgi:hypothetical protein